MTMFVSKPRNGCGWEQDVADYRTYPVVVRGAFCHHPAPCPTIDRGRLGFGTRKKSASFNVSLMLVLLLVLLLL